MSGRIEVTAWVDFLCPWSYVVAHRLERLLAEEDDLVVDWRSYLLYPEKEDRDLAEFRQSTTTWMEPASAEPDLTFSLWATGNRPPSHSTPAQAALKLAADYGPDAATAYRKGLFHAHFGENRTISDSVELIRVARAAGIPDDEFAMRLRGQYSDLVRKALLDHQTATRAGIDTSPAVLVGGKFLAKGPVLMSQLRELTDRVRSAAPSALSLTATDAVAVVDATPVPVPEAPVPTSAPPPKAAADTDRAGGASIATLVTNTGRKTPSGEFDQEMVVVWDIVD